MLTGIITAIIGVIEVLVGLRFVFLLLGANPANGFVSVVYDWSTPLVQPFAGIFGQSAEVTGRGAVVPSVFDWTALIAFVVYGLLAIVISRLVVHHPSHA